MPDLMLYYHTLRHLTARQWLGQGAHRLRRARERWLGVPAPAAAPPFPGCRWQPVRPFEPAAEVDMDDAGMLSGRMCFIGQEREAGWPPRWQPPEAPRLWQYNLHYHDWLWSLDFADVRAAALDWIARHRPAAGATGWESYPTSLRLMNWCWLFWGRWRPEVERDAAACEALWGSIHAQAQWLAGRLELHLLGNHLLENALALALVGSCFEGTVAMRWRQLGRRLLVRELDEQLLPDGLHFERSPMYHLRALRVIENLCATGDPELAALLGPRLEPMRRALALCCHPDGQIALLNDSAMGIYPAPGASIARLEAPLPEGAWALPDAGYYGWRAGGDYLIYDAGPIGPDYLPGHAHADIFSFELSLGGRRVIVDSGTHDYESGETRRRCRSTAAHNTVELNGHDQCEMWGAFRVGRRGRPRGVNFMPRRDGFTLEGWHDGYHRLPGRPTHRRRFDWSAGEGLVIQDRVESGWPVTAVSRLHLHPACEVEQISPETVAVRTGGEPVCTITAQGAGIEIGKYFYFPKFSTKVSGVVLAISKRAECIEFGWQLAQPGLEHPASHDERPDRKRLPREAPVTASRESSGSSA